MNTGTQTPLPPKLSWLETYGWVIRKMAEQYVAHAKERYPLRDYVNEKAAEIDTSGEHLPIVKMHLRDEIRRLERLGRGGY